MLKKLWSIAGNTQRLDGGAMFGNAPRAVWERWIAPDDKNRIPLACRALLLREDSGRSVLFEAGIGAFFPPKLRERYGVEQAEHVLLVELERAGTPHSEVDVVVLSHLHFDHAGGLLASFQEGRPPELLFPKARFVVGRAAFERAKRPHARDRASFIPELPALLEASGRLELVDGERSAQHGDDYRVHFSDGHTPGLMLGEIACSSGPLLYAGDLVPGAAWVHLPITMGYDRYPELLIDEKERILSSLAERGGSLFFTHDPRLACAAVLWRDGRYVAEAAQESLWGAEL